ncbi:MAG: hypothetical protein KGQ49_02900, partial [Verrucomicrobia bacterium]|nr:hypothetical protein [Verrucomicrobiota bacterium]
EKRYWYTETYHRVMHHAIDVLGAEKVLQNPDDFRELKQNGEFMREVIRRHREACAYADTDVGVWDEETKNKVEQWKKEHPAPAP